MGLGNRAEAHSIPGAAPLNTATTELRNGLDGAHDFVV